jgi:hypothetical protein
MRLVDETEPDAEIVRLLGDIKQLRAMIDAELEKDGGSNRPLMLACSKLLYEKNERLAELGWTG